MNKMWRMKILMKKVGEIDILNENLSDMRKGSNSKHERKVMFVVLLESKQNSPGLTGFTDFTTGFSQQPLTRLI